MKASVRTRTGHVITTSEHENIKDLFRAVAEIQDIFNADSECGACQSQDLSFRVRTHNSNDFFEISCNTCTAQLSFGQSRAGGLFPKRKDDNGPLPNRGWKIWRALAAPQ